jgi:hypothetical protein
VRRLSHFVKTWAFRKSIQDASVTPLEITHERYVQSTERHAIHLQFDISTTALKVRVVKTPRTSVVPRSVLGDRGS